MDATTTTSAPPPPARGDQGPAPSSPATVAAEADTWLRRFRAVLIGILGGVVAGIGALAFYTSFEAIKAYANGSHGIDPHHDFAIPLLVDSFIVVATGADLWFTTTGRRRHLWEIWWPKALLAGAAGVSFTLNVAHVHGHNWAARGVAAIPPAALILGVELLMQVLRRATMLRTERLTSAAAVPVPEVEVSRGEGPGTLALPAPAGEAAKAAGDSAPKSRASRTGRARAGKRAASVPKSRQAREFVLGEWAEGRQPTGGEIDRRFQVSEGYGRRLLRELTAGNGHQAGNGHTPAPEPASTSDEGGGSA